MNTFFDTSFNTRVNTSFNTNLTTTLGLFLVFASLNGCAPVADIVPQTPNGSVANSYPPAVAQAPAQDVAQANAYLASGQRREAASAYFAASNNYNSPERERLILQAAELAATMKDVNLTQRYLAPLNFNQLNLENQTRFRFTQAQLAFNDRNYRETLRILPQRVAGLPQQLALKILGMRMSAAQASGDKVALVQELVLQEPTLRQAHEISLNHDRIWNHAQQIPAFQLNEAKDRINHPVLKNWLSLAQLARLSKNAPSSKKQTLRNDLGSWLQRNPTHPGQSRAISLLNAVPRTTVTPYGSDLQRPIVNPKPVVKRPTTNKPVARTPVQRPVVRRPVTTPPPVKKPVVNTQAKKPVAESTVKPDPNVRSLYEKIKREIK